VAAHNGKRLTVNEYSYFVSKPPSWNEIRTNAQQFATRWEGTSDENAESQSFWNEFLGIFGIDRKRVATFEARAKRESTGGRGRIDLLWPGTLVAEHKSAGKDLATAENQALDYLESIDVKDFPGVIVTSDFSNFRVRDLGGDNIPFTFPLADLPKEIDRFGFIAGYRQRKFGDKDEEEANVKAARLMGDLYEELARTGYEGHDASILMTRLLLLMFADDTGMWEKGLFSEFVETRTQPDGSDLGSQLAMLFQVLDKAETARPATVDELLLRFPYVNGHLFSDRIDIPSFDKRMRDELVRCTEFDWSKISPAIFGSLFQAVKSKEERRTLGEHYTTEFNILRALAPLFLDDLWVEYESVRDNASRLERLHDKIAKIRVLDPACGCGNFLVIAYRELRRLELAILTRIADLSHNTQMHLDVSNMVRVRLSHFYGIEIEEWPARIAETAMFLVDQQANHELAITFGNAPDRLPIMNAANITVGNALRIDWESVLSASECSYIVGNPPFVGKQTRSIEQQEDMALVFGSTSGAGNLDYVTAWYGAAAKYMTARNIGAALVSTSSICRGEQTAILWPYLFSRGMEITFAYLPFKWSSEAPGAAQVSVVIVGFANKGFIKKKRLLEEDPDTRESRSLEVGVISPYLTGGTSVVVTKRRIPISDAPIMAFGSMPNDGGHLILSTVEADTIRETDPVAAQYIRKFWGAQELLDGKHRCCYWMIDVDPKDVASSPTLRSIAQKTRSYRESSSRAATKALADFPLRFGEVRQPNGRYLGVPSVSSERRRYLPTAFFEPDEIASNLLLTIDGADEYIFGMLSSTMFITWLGGVGGRLESRFRVSAEVVYNNFPFPRVSDAERSRVVNAAKDVLTARKEYSTASLADLYNPAAMPESLVRAHIALDRAVDGTFGKGVFPTVSSRLSELLEHYSKLVEPANLLTELPAKRTRKKKSD
jgi:type I restriction-modification system DNA methylase subunit